MAAGPGAPSGVSPVLEALGHGLDATIGVGWRFQLASLGSRLSRTREDTHDHTRSQRVLDWFLRVHTPAWLAVAGRTSEAQTLRSLPPVVDRSSATIANSTLQSVLAQVQADAHRASEELAQPLQGIPPTPAAADAWNGAVTLVEEAVRSEPISALQAALTEAARAAAPSLADSSGWNWAVSARDMAVQSFAWRSARAQIASCVAAAVKGEDWGPASQESGKAAALALAPAAEEIAQAALKLFESLIDAT